MLAIASRPAVLGRPAVLVKHAHAVRRLAMSRKCAVRASAAGAAGEDPYQVCAHAGRAEARPAGPRSCTKSIQHAPKACRGAAVSLPPPPPAVAASRRCLPPLRRHLPPPNTHAGLRALQVLGIPRNADSTTVQRAYKKQMAELKGRRGAADEAAAARLEAAHSALMMAALTSRLQGGGGGVEKEVLYADRARYFPWRPRLWMAARDILLYSAIAQALLLAWALLTPLTAGSQPVIWGERRCWQGSG